MVSQLHNSSCHFAPVITPSSFDIDKADGEVGRINVYSTFMLPPELSLFSLVAITRSTPAVLTQAPWHTPRLCVVSIPCRTFSSACCSSMKTRRASVGVAPAEAIPSRGREEGALKSKSPAARPSGGGSMSGYRGVESQSE